jgi:hypothetical protein
MCWVFIFIQKTIDCGSLISLKTLPEGFMNGMINGDIYWFGLDKFIGKINKIC